MKTLILGFVVFCLWAWFASYFYINKIDALVANTEVSNLNPKVEIDTSRVDSLKKQEFDYQKLLSEIPKTHNNYFDFDKAVILLSNDLENYVVQIKPLMEYNNELKISIVGHSDAFGTVDYNYKLGLLRASTVKAFCENMGISANQIEIASKGELEPEAENKTSEGRAKNRRTVITLK